MFILGSPSRAYDTRYKLICKQIFSEKILIPGKYIGKILILIPLMRALLIHRHLETLMSQEMSARMPIVSAMRIFCLGEFNKKL